MVGDGGRCDGEGDREGGGGSIKGGWRVKMPALIGLPRVTYTPHTPLQKSALSLLLLDQVGCRYARDSPLWEM